ncbi:hypothetical protein [Accumulibacter sp.]|uniref:hypothetical protein n=1 Tax=Accumulibacter sp. TaxID=2053492 RepID=UPI002C36AEC5|nr:hypothetical protein [Accumulibacter sp.]HMW81280.1 hypothetical protein [Accumulibacter sp.]HNC27942.1 hypothetical protein [Accumulibacter sp.]HND40150.1 hypothetical protein [Accumulibacter sp.]
MIVATTSAELVLKATEGAHALRQFRQELIGTLPTASVAQERQFANLEGDQHRFNRLAPPSLQQRLQDFQKSPPVGQTGGVVFVQQAEHGHDVPAHRHKQATLAAGQPTWHAVHHPKRADASLVGVDQDGRGIATHVRLAANQRAVAKAGVMPRIGNLEEAHLRIDGMRTKRSRAGKTVDAQPYPALEQDLIVVHHTDPSHGRSAEAADEPGNRVQFVRARLVVGTVSLRLSVMTWLGGFDDLVHIGQKKNWKPIIPHSGPAWRGTESVILRQRLAKIVRDRPSRSVNEVCRATLLRFSPEIGRPRRANTCMASTAGLPRQKERVPRRSVPSPSIVPWRTASSTDH